MAKKILIADDEPHILSLLKTRLLACHYDIVTAIDGVDCLNKIVEEKPDLIILDIMMPKLTGYEVAQKLQGIAFQIPIIVISAKSSMEDAFRTLSISSFVPKPFEASDLIIKIQDLIGPAESNEDAEIPENHDSIVLLKGVDRYMTKKIKQHLEEAGFYVFVAYDEPEVLKQAEKLTPNFILLQYWEDAEIFDAIEVFKDLKQLRKAQDISVWVYCLQSLGVEASKDVPHTQLLPFRESPDLLRKISKRILAHRHPGS